MIPKDEQLDLGTQPRYTRQWGYNASTGSTSMFRRFADVFNSGAREETRLRNALRMQIGQDIARNFVSLAADKESDRMGIEMRNLFGPDLASYRPGKGMTFHDRRPSTVKYEHVGGFDDVTTTNINYNKNYDDKTPTESIGEPDTSNPPQKSTRKKSTRTTKKTVNNPRANKPSSKTKVEPAEDGIQDAEIVEDGPSTSKPTTTVAPGPEKKTKTRTPRPGREGAIAEDPDANPNRKNKPTKPDDLNLQGN